jgi:uncharacterized protein YndB with AHSA1/START domain
MRVTDRDPVEVSVHIAAMPETVFSYFTDPVRYVQWMGSEATLEPVAGGAYRVWMRDGVETCGHFVEVDPPYRVVFTWGWTHDRAVPHGSTRVEVTLAEEDGGTRVVLRHYGLPDEGQRTHHRAGWTTYLQRLVATAQGGDPSPDPNATEPAS